MKMRNCGDRLVALRRNDNRWRSNMMTVAAREQRDGALVIWLPRVRVKPLVQLRRGRKDQRKSERDRGSPSADSQAPLIPHGGRIVCWSWRTRNQENFASGGSAIDVFPMMPQPRSVILSVTRNVLLLVVCLSLTAPRVALQSVAWGAMILKYSQQASLANAVAQTFDGDHPCELCKRLSTTQQSEKKRDAQPRPVQPDLICATRTIPLIAPQSDFQFPTVRVTACTLVISPPIPPPRFELI